MVNLSIISSLSNLGEINNVLQNTIFLIFLTLTSGGFLWLSLWVSGQKWIGTYSNTVTYLLLPVVGFIIIKVISDNIALSLGLVGALSIVRFRHPVKSPLELTAYFILLTIGISYSAQPLFGIALTVIAVFVIITVSKIWNVISLRFPESGANLSMDLGSRIFLELEGSTPLPTEILVKSIIYSSEDPVTKRFIYKFGFHTTVELNKFKENISSYKLKSSTYFE
jgi:hypothetical protein